MDLDDLVDEVEDIVPNGIGAGRQIVGGRGNDRIEGTNSSDEIFADPVPVDDQGGDDEVWARGGDDLVRAFGGNNRVYGGPGDDTLYTADGDDEIQGGAGSDEIQGGRGTDRLWGGPGDDEVRGGEGDDLVFGGPGDDRVIGSTGNDMLHGGQGADALEGREGRDLFVWSETGDGVDRVFDYELGIDRLGLADLVRGPVTSAADLDRYVSLRSTGNGAEMVLRVDPDGDGAAPWHGLAVLNGHPGLSAAALYLAGDLSLDNQPAPPRFSALDYIASHDDLILAFGNDPAAGKRHFLANGHAEGRAVTFDGLQYIASHEDLLLAFGPDRTAAAQHFIGNGRAEGRTRDGFDEVQYVANYADLQDAFGTDYEAATRHFITNGYLEGRTDQPLEPADFML